MSSTGVEKIVERQMRNWELARSQKQAAPQAHRTFEFITISRQKSSGGSALARRLGERIGWQVYDREILNYMAHNDAVQGKIYEFADEHAEGYLESILKNLGFEGPSEGSDYFRKLVSSVGMIAQSNHAIFVGRGVNFVLPAEHGLRVRVVAPEDLRFKRYAEGNGCSLAAAAAAVRRLDADRAKFLREHFDVDGSSPEHYNMVVNTAMLTTDMAVAMVVEGLEHKTRVRVRRK
ncbi:MAG: cytidylate kinase-like family protein [Planctomycetota bacterium]